MPAVMIVVISCLVLIVDNSMFNPYRQHEIAVKTATIFANKMQIPNATSSCEIIESGDVVPCTITTPTEKMTVGCVVTKRNTLFINRTFCTKTK